MLYGSCHLIDKPVAESNDQDAAKPEIIFWVHHMTFGEERKGRTK
jgi:hypothetical protein